MSGQSRNRLAGLALICLLALNFGEASAAVQYLNDGARQNAAGGWDLPTQGTCPADPTKVTRPDCLALRIVAASSGACTTALGSWTTSGVCNDLVNTNQTACEARPDRLWNSGTGVCAVAMKGDDRNRVVCANHGGTWVTTGTCTGSWTFQNSSAYTPPLFTGTTNPGPGDQCLRCHNSVTEYNGPRLRDVNWALRQGHKNMSRKVEPGSGIPWAGPGYECSVHGFTNRADCETHGGTWDPTLVIYPSDETGNPFNWATGEITISGVARSLAWIFADWISPLPRAIARVPAATGNVCTLPAYTDQMSCLANTGAQWLGGVCELPAYTTSSTCATNGGTWATGPTGVCDDPTKTASTCPSGHWIQNAGASYSCARCHTTGWTSDSAINAAKEPEKSFPGLTWDRTTDAAFGQVNLAGGVAGDTNKHASWDNFGIACSRCHTAVVDNASNGGVLPFSAPAGMSSHHSNLTVPDFPAGCSLASCGGSRCSSTNCAPSGGIWSYGYCTDSRFLIGGVPFATSKTACETNGGLGEPAPGMGPGVWITPCSDNNYGTQAACVGAGATWTLPTTSCSVAGVCNKGTCSDAVYPNKNECEDNGGTWTGYADQTSCQAVPGGQWAATSDIISCEDADGHWNGNLTQRGQVITALCMNCHRQETGGFPYDAANPASSLKVGPNHGSVEFLSHWHGNQYLNSPHAKFSGSITQVATGKFNYAMTGEYKSFFMTEGEAANTGNGCTGCHNVHKSTVHEAYEPNPNEEGAIREECTACHAKSLNLVQHPGGPGTPLQDIATEPFHACVTCHMPQGTHLWRINVDPNYSTFPTTALTATTNANAVQHGNYPNAVWVDLDRACGQCHGGGTAQAFTTGTIAASSKVLTVADTTGFEAGQRIKVADAGSFKYDDLGLIRGDFESFIVSVSPPSTLNLAGGPPIGVTGKQVTQNPTNGGGYLSKLELASLARGIHNDKPLVSFGYTIGSPNTLTVNVDASATTCSGDNANCDAFEWDWGDGTMTTGATSSHTYATGGSKSILLTVEQYGVGGSSLTRTVNVYTPDVAPIVAGNCAFDANTWTETLTDTSSDDVLLKQVTVNWGDGSLIGNDLTAPFGPFTHTYVNAGTFTLTHKAIDSLGQQATRTCMVSPAYFSISGTVVDSGAVPIASATVVLKKGTQVIRTVYSASNGTYAIGTLKPGTYTINITKTGYAFPAPPSVTVGPSSSGNTVTGTATGPKGGGSHRNPKVDINN